MARGSLPSLYLLVLSFVCHTMFASYYKLRGIREQIVKKKIMFYNVMFYFKKRHNAVILLFIKQLTFYSSCILSKLFFFSK